ncbi:DEAD/DEAH box helicase [Methylotuvimicrobium sp. KM2]|uniref:DEAD/DEAH box helicase n=1 Tax=Methylotuvimicrobium sp. KM2 TaxID=3133976 RepID=UPI003100FCC6
MKAIISDKTYLTGLGDDQIKFIQKSLIIPNPKYTDAIRQGRRPFGIDRTIELYESTDDGLVIPRGIHLDGLIDIDDRRHSHPVEIETSIEPRAYQERALSAMLETGGGVLVAPTGSGKTTIGIELAARLRQRCLVLVKSLDLARQWQGAIKKFTGLDAGLIGGGEWREGDQFTIATVQTLIKHQGSLDYGLLICDECHNAPANQVYAVINRQAAKYRFGLSATPQRRDNLEALMFASLGPVCAEIEQHEVEGAVLPVVVKTVECDFTGDPQSWSEFLQMLSDDPERNKLIVNSAIKASRKTGVAILTATVDHAERLTAMIEQQGLDAVLLHGKLPAKQKAEAMQRAETANLIIGTLSLLSEGIDWPHVGAVIFGAPVSAVIDKNIPAATRLIQSIGRARRPYPGKQRAFVLDIVDQCGFGVGAWRKRNHVYRMHGFDVI